MQAQSGVQQPVSLSPQQAQGQPSQPAQGEAVSAGGPDVVSVRVTEGPWQVSLCDCCAEGCGPWCYGCLCPSCTHASARSNMDDSNCFFNCCLGGPIALRNIVRENYNIKGNCCMDIITVFCCIQCSACQALNESTKRGPVNRVWGENRSNVEIPWNNGLFNICEDALICVLGCFFGRCVTAYARSKFDDSNCIFNFCCMTGCLTRSLIREGYNIEGSCWGDVFLPCICGPCSACQMMNEVNSRGNVHQTVVSVAPVGQQPQSMNR